MGVFTSSNGESRFFGWDIIGLHSEYMYTQTGVVLPSIWLVQDEQNNFWIYQNDSYLGRNDLTTCIRTFYPYISSSFLQIYWLFSPEIREIVLLKGAPWNNWFLNMVYRVGKSPAVWWSNNKFPDLYSWIAPSTQTVWAHRLN